MRIIEHSGRHPIRRVALVTPELVGSRSGNSITAVRWASILRDLGYTVRLSHEFDDEPADIMIALNAYRTAGSIQRFRQQYSERPLVVALTGTDLYRFLDSHREQTMGAIEAADRLVVLNNLAHKMLAPDHRPKCHVILESATRLPNGRRPSIRHFDICVVGHLRPEKDPLRTAQAAQGLPESSRIRIRQYGKAYTKEWAAAAQKEMVDNRRYTWFGEVPHWQIRRVLATSRLMVVSSEVEGGPNCLSEAIVAGLPVITTDIDGCVGVLGPDYPGYFPAGDTIALRDQLTRAENDAPFLTELEEFIVRTSPRFTREQERDRWVSLLEELFESNSR